MKSTLTPSRTGTKTKPNRRVKPKRKPVLPGLAGSVRTPGGKKTKKSNRTSNGKTTSHGRRQSKKGGAADRFGPYSLSSIKPWKLILATLLAGVCGLLYITHVFSTQQLLQEVQILETEVNRVNRIHAEHRHAYDRMVGPKEIYQRAREEGFVNAGPADQVLIIR